jgi:mannose-6-phosphate isomerase-like protein (cupin superfamily)
MGMELDVHAPVLLAPGEGEVVTDRPERTLRILADLDDLIVTWFRYEPGEQGPDPHIHQHHTDAFYVLEGEIEVSLGPELTTVRARPGMIAAAPPNLIHTYRNAGDDSAVFINLHVPSTGFGDYIRGRNPAFDQHEPPADGGRPFVDAVFCGADDAELVEHDTSALRILCDLPQLSALDLTFAPEFEGVDPHVHEDHVDSFYVLEGEIEFLGGDEPRRGGPGTFFAAPRSTSHGFRNPGPGPLRVFNLHTPPGGFVDRVRLNA